MTGSNDSEPSTPNIDRTVGRIREVADTVESPADWRVLVPTEMFDAVKDRLDVEYDQGTYYDGIALCYTDHHDEPRIEYAAELAEHIDPPEVRCDGGKSDPPAPEILDVVDAPAGRDCQLWRGEEPHRCDNDAAYLFVYDSNGDDDGPRRPSNALACDECFKPPAESRAVSGVAD